MMDDGPMAGHTHQHHYCAKKTNRVLAVVSMEFKNPDQGSKCLGSKYHLATGVDFVQLLHRDFKEF